MSNRKQQLTISEKIRRLKKVKQVLDFYQVTNFTEEARKILKSTPVETALREKKAVIFKDEMWHWNNKFKITKEFTEKVYELSNQILKKWKNSKTKKKVKKTIQKENNPSEIVNKEESFPYKEGDIANIVQEFTIHLTETNNNLNSIKAGIFDLTMSIKDLHEKIQILEDAGILSKTGN